MVNKSDIMEQKTRTKDLKTKTPYVQYQDTEEWAIIEHLLTELENNQDIELKTASEYVVGYLVEKLRNKDFLIKEKSKVKMIGKRVNGGVGLRLTANKRGSKKL